MSRREIHIGDPLYDDWPVVADYEDAQTASAFLDHLSQLGLRAVLTSDWELDAFGRADIALRVTSDDYGEAVDLLEGLEPGD